MGKRIEVKVGEKFGRLTVTKESPRLYNRRYMECLCDCGKEKRLRIDRLNAKSSCGCLGKEIRREKMCTLASKNPRIYDIWNMLKQRCLNKKNPNYLNYGGRGIAVCSEWLTFKSFYDWSINSGYKANLTIERIDNDLGYSPSNCKWATRLEQANNTRRNLIVEYKGKRQTLSQWAREVGIDKGTLLYRLKSGWTVAKSFSILPTHSFSTILFRGKTQSIGKWAKELNIKDTTLRRRLNKYKWSIEKALTTVVRSRTF